MSQKKAPASNANESATKTDKRSLLGLLFNPQLGSSFAGLQQSTNMFSHLLAAVFALYGLFPKNHPALKDENMPLSLFQVLGIARQHVEFTREAMPRTIMFFAVVATMFISGFVAFFSILSLFIGHAHAANALDAGIFTAPSTGTDIAQLWLNYLFGTAGSWSSISPIVAGSGNDAGFVNPFPAGMSLQTALIACLGAYSNAILIIAALILFYHLASMVVETAHHGQVMGKRASQVWAPIRLVVAIGLLVPINSGLSTGQYMVVKIASLGSAMASNVWSQYFLPTLTAYNPTAVPPSAPSVAKIGYDIIRMEACKIAWNNRVLKMYADFQGTTYDFTAAPADNGSPSFMQNPVGKPYTMGGLVGKKFSYTTGNLGDTGGCGWYFIPGDGATGNALMAAAAAQQEAAINSTMSEFRTAAGKIASLMGTSTAALPLSSDTSAQLAVNDYLVTLNANMANLANNGQQNQVQAAISQIGQYGWVMAGTFLNAVSRMQGELTASSQDTAPVSSPPIYGASNVGDNPNHSHDDEWDIHKKVADDLAVFDFYSSRVQQNDVGTSLQCAAMVGLTVPEGGSLSISNALLGMVERLAEFYGVWSTASSAHCGPAMAAGASTFSLGITISAVDPFTQMAALGHRMIEVAIATLEIAFGANAAGGIAGALGNIPGIGGFISKFVGGVASAVGGVASFLSLIFWSGGFVLAYLVPLMPFMRFFFATISWIAAIIEAVVAVPLIALAHLNPEGEGLAGQAKTAYGFLFDLFLRPVLVIFGLICGLIIFLIALSLLNFGYAVAVAGTGGTVQGHQALSHIIYSVLYVSMVYICANHSFALIDHLPKHAMLWYGAQGASAPQMGDASSMEGIAATVSTLSGKQAIGALAGAGSKLGAGIGGMIPKPKTPGDTGNGNTTGNGPAPKLKGGGQPTNAPQAQQTATPEPSKDNVSQQ